MTTTLSRQHEMTRAIGSKNDVTRSRSRSQIEKALYCLFVATNKQYAPTKVVLLSLSPIHKDK